MIQKISSGTKDQQPDIQQVRDQESCHSHVISRLSTHLVSLFGTHPFCQLRQSCALLLEMLSETSLRPDVQSFNALLCGVQETRMRDPLNHRFGSAKVKRGSPPEKCFEKDKRTEDLEDREDAVFEVT